MDKEHYMAPFIKLKKGTFPVLHLTLSTAASCLYLRLATSHLLLYLMLHLISYTQMHSSQVSHEEHSDYETDLTKWQLRPKTEKSDFFPLKSRTIHWYKWNIFLHICRLVHQVGGGIQNLVKHWIFDKHCDITIL